MDELRYTSTRGNGAEVTSAQAIKQGLADDGGLFMPLDIPLIADDTLVELCKMSYAERAAHVLGLFLTDYSHDELLSDCIAAYGEDRFPGGAAPIKGLGDSIRVLELWHGPTCAFKDMALQIMPKLLSRALTKTGEMRKAMILVATSGDTGKAALEGYRDAAGISIKVFYPTGGVSRIQKLQMASQEGNNVSVTAIRGNFDDAQNGVKRIFSDADFAAELNEAGCFLSSANSINWGRLAPQIVYYISAYCDMINAGDILLGEEIDVCVPTGNFGNIFAAYIAKCMGLPINKLICASNSNNILTDFLATGTYDRNRKFYTTMSPSMDILISSNLERLLYVTAGSDKTAGWMKELSEKGVYSVDDETKTMLQRSFEGFYCDEASTQAAIKRIFNTYGYLIDTHTAVAMHCAEQYLEQNPSKRHMLVVSTASPYKFAASVLDAVSDEKPGDDFETIETLCRVTGAAVPAPLASLKDKKVRFDTVINADEMKADVAAFGGIKA